MQSRLFTCVVLGALLASSSAQTTQDNCTTIAQAIGSGSFPALASFLAGNAALSQQLAVPEDAYTVFLPTNEVALAALADGTFTPSNLFDLIQLAIVPGSYPAASLSDGQTLVSQGGPALTVAIAGSTVTITGPLNTVTVAKPDAFYPLCSSSVIHLVDGVLLPASAENSTTVVVGTPGVNGTIIGTNGTVISTNGTIVGTNGTAVSSNGTVTIGNGTVALNGTVTVNGTTIVNGTTVIGGTNGTIATNGTVIDAAVPCVSIIQAGGGEPSISLVVTAVSSQITPQLSAELAAPNGTGYTIFAPTNAATQTLVTNIASVPNTAALLLTHIVPRALLVADLTDGLALTTLANNTITIKLVGATVTVVGPEGDSVTIIKPDIQGPDPSAVCSGSVVQEIDGVLGLAPLLNATDSANSDSTPASPSTPSTRTPSPPAASSSASLPVVLAIALGAAHLMLALA